MIEKDNYKKQTKKLLERISSLSVNSVFWELNSSIGGLSKNQIEINRCQYGTNVIEKSEKKTKLNFFLEAFLNPFSLLLIILVLVLGFTDVILPILRNNKINVITITIIIALVIISGIIKFIQETKSNEATEKLIAMIKKTVTVDREKNLNSEISSDELVVGDIFYLFAGSVVPADARLIDSKNLIVSQASLTGESDHLERNSEKIKKSYDSITDTPNLVFAGSNVISGFAKAIAISTGSHTILGSIAKTVGENDLPTNFEKGVNNVSWILIKFILVMVPLVFIISGITKNDWLDALVFSLSVAVGLTPEMLPMIVATCLSKGAVSMSKKKTVIKNLNSMQNFGAMNILCTDKTGTLTEDKIILELHINVHGEVDDNVYKYAFINSYFQTGFKNSLDEAIISHDSKPKEAKNFELVNEIPFDFKRRRLSVVVREPEFIGSDEKLIITKGALEEIVEICTNVKINKNIEKFNGDIKSNIIETATKLNEKGMRVVAIATKKTQNKESFTVEDEKDMTLIGFLAFLDPPRESSAKALKMLWEHGVTTKILTGDNERVTRSVCEQVGLPADYLITGVEISKMSDVELSDVVKKATVFTKLTPDQKLRIVRILRQNGNVVGFMGDGINDAAAIKNADIGISVENAVDITKEAADVILMEKNLLVLENGIIEGRKTYVNMIKYIKITATSNFGNMFSVLAASALSPFMPMTSLHLIFLNLMSDISSMAFPWDNVDEESLKEPRRWDAGSIGKFMVWNGPISSVFDWITYAILYFLICPKFISNGLDYHSISSETLISNGIFSGANMQRIYAATFQTGWLIECIWTQIAVMFVLRTIKIPILQSKPSKFVALLSLFSGLIITTMPFVAGSFFGLVPMPLEYFWWLFTIIIAYVLCASIIKTAYIKFNKSWL
ncbi:MAG: magnesium-translocating P-type ATPase [Oscillospiraceae bacterium]|nr:magnesium-translocating P-type ATPase [Oscillospiraceae bacterium]